MIPIVNGELSTIIKELVQGLEDLKIRGWVETIQNDSITKIDRNTVKSPRDWWRLSVTQTLLKKPSANVDAKNSQQSEMIMILIITIETKEILKNLDFATKRNSCGTW